MHAVANPLINITLQGRHDTYPKRRGMTRVPELLAAGVNVGFGHDCVMDPWYSLGSADMLEVAAMGLHVAQMTSQSQCSACFDAVTVNNARILGLDGYGLEPGCRADFVLLQAGSPVEAIRLRAQRLLVVRGGRCWRDGAGHGDAARCPGGRARGFHATGGTCGAGGPLARMVRSRDGRNPAQDETDRIADQPLRAQGARRDGREEARLPVRARGRLGQRRHPRSPTRWARCPAW